MGLRQWFTRYARALGALAKGGFLAERRMNAQYPFLIFLALLAIVSIRSSHVADQKVHRISELRKELKNVHSDFVETRSQLMESSAETKVRERAAEIGLHLPLNAPVTLSKRSDGSK
jgi:ABC-type transport system involved in cytochrome bd biosynthesis fused ATPase/permease subunit